jgi:Domain of unknown function (DUF6285)
MRDLPDGARLAALAADFAASDLERLPPELRRLTLAMIERCRAIAQSEAGQGMAALAPFQQWLEREYGPGDTAAHFLRLTQEIRAGRYDDSAEVRRLLWELTLQKLRESNPKFLAAHGLS